IGALLGMALGWLLATTLPPDITWRWLLGSTAVPSVVLLLLLTRIPESPRWLLAHRRETEALAVMQTIRDPGDIAGELDAIRTGAGRMGGSYRDLLRPGIRWALLTGVLLGLFNNWTGGTGVGSYLPTLFQQGGFPAAGDALAVVLLVSCVNVGFTVLSIWLVDHVGRRPLWMGSAGAMTVSIALLGWAYHVGVTGPAIIGLTLLVVMCHALGLGPLPWLMISELYSGPLRVRAVSVCTTVLWLSGFTSVLVFPPLAAWSERQIGSAAGAFWVYAGMSLLALLFGWRLLPETKGKTLEKIARHWRT
ncbi:MAG: MFS transporter, partial [Kiritimatiellota bacterium]|nr:MFS transporter [Kiritimatiellota bacterium]